MIVHSSIILKWKCVCLYLSLVLIVIIVTGNHAVLVVLLEAGCPANLPDIHGVYPIHYAVNEARGPLPTGEDTRERENQGLWHTYASNCEHTADRDIEEYTEENVVHSQNVRQCLSILLDKGVPVDCRDAQGRTPLHWACQLPSKYSN